MNWAKRNARRIIRKARLKWKSKNGKARQQDLADFDAMVKENPLARLIVLGVPESSSE